jgi:D-inositol-3-phosphate glycosyltransferase
MDRKSRDSGENELRVAMLSYHTCPLATLGGKDTGGMNVYVRDLTRQLGVIGVHVDVFTRSQDEHVPHVLHDLGYGNRVVHVPAGPEVPLAKPELTDYIPEFVEGVESFSDSKGTHYDLIHSHYWMSGMAAKELQLAWRTPVIHMFHTLGLMKQRVARMPGEAEGDYRVQGEKDVLRMADRIVAATQAEFAQLQWLYQADTDKINIIPPGVDVSHFYPIPSDEAKEYVGIAGHNRMLLFVGRIEPLKGIDTLIEAIAVMRQRKIFVDKEFCIAVIGGDPDVSPQALSDEMARLKQLCEQYGLRDLITFLGRRSQDSLPYYYSAAEAVVVPSFYESFGMVALEAMACGTPVVASEVGGLAFLVQDGKTGFTVPVDEPQALADRLSELMMDPALRARMGAAGAKFAQQYAWEKIADRIHGLYKDVLGENNSGSAD